MHSRFPFLIGCYLLSLSSFAQPAGPALEIRQLTGNFYIYTTYNYYEGNRIPANGMYLLTSQGALLFDSPWDTTQFQPLLDSILARHGQKVVWCLATHFHDDRSGGLTFYGQQGIATYTTRKTDELSQQRSKNRARFIIPEDTVFTIGEYSFRVFCPGPGHTPDNIVAWFEKERILYGGCLIKSVEDATLGYLGDADEQRYAATLQNVKRSCRRPAYIIPGHSDWTSRRSLKHSLKMAKALRRKNK